MHLFKSLILIIYLIISLYVAVSNSYKILGILPTDYKSHYIFGSALMRALAVEGHEVYVISPFRQQLNISNYHEIFLESRMQEFKDNSNSSTKNSYDINVTDISERLLTASHVQQLMASNHTFDVVICEIFLSEALFGFSEHFGASLIGLSTVGSMLWSSDMVGSPSPPSFVPSSSLSLSDHMSLKERVRNQLYITMEWLLLNYYYLPQQAALYKKYFPHLKRDMYTVRKNAAVIFVNTHISLGYPRPYMPNHIGVAGMHISRKLLRRPLPTDIEKFIQGAEDGVVYFSLGTKVESKNLQDDRKEELLKAFRQLKQRVLWKYEGPALEDKPDNVYISDWFAQDDILAHENVKVFITHGGLLSITESIYHGKPIVGMPILDDQVVNLAKVENLGIGVILQMGTFKAEALVEAVERVTNDMAYTERMQNISARYRDQPISPVDLAVYWVEYVVRHKGAKYLHCAGLDLNFFQYHNIDIFGLISVVILFSVYLVVILPIKLLKSKKNYKLPGKSK